jgi:RNase H-fold protein (predicted Holliday junction resolvase)
MRKTCGAIARPRPHPFPFVTSIAQTLSQPVILGFDPGRLKCGLAVMGLDRRLYHHVVVEAEAAIATIETLRQQYPVSLIVMGDQTTSRSWQERLATLPNIPRIMRVDERYTTLEARDRYWQMYPPRGLRQLLPKGLRVPPRPIDDIVAILLIERYLDRLTGKG